MISISKNRFHALVTAAWMNRAMIALVYVWFGMLKVFGVSPAESLVTKLFDITLAPYMSIQEFLILLGLSECLIGLLWLFPRITKIAFWVMMGIYLRPSYRYCFCPTRHGSLSWP